MHKLILGQYKDLKLPEIPMFTEDDLKLGTLEAVKKLANKWAKSNKPAETGDEVIIDLRPECDNLFVPELAKSNYKFTLGDPSVLVQFHQIIGSKAGDELVLEIPFPFDFSVQRVAGKAVVFHVTVLEVIHKHPVELTDEISRQIDHEVTGLEELKYKLRQFVSNNWLLKISEDRTRFILDEIAKNSQYELDPEEFKQEYEKIQAAKQNDLFTSKNPQTLNILLSGDVQLLKEQSKLLAEKNIVEKLILTEIAGLEKITVEPPELRETKSRLLESAGDEQSFKRLFPSEECLHQYVLREKVIDLLWEWNHSEFAQ